MTFLADSVEAGDGSDWHKQTEAWCTCLSRSQQRAGTHWAITAAVNRSTSQLGHTICHSACQLSQTPAWLGCESIPDLCTSIRRSLWQETSPGLDSQRQAPDMFNLKDGIRMRGNSAIVHLSNILYCFCLMDKAEVRRVSQRRLRERKMVLLCCWNIAKCINGSQESISHVSPNAPDPRSPL
jgi:hypothetical protein